MSSSPQPVADLLADLARGLAALGVRWFLFGAQAAILHGSARLSADVDVTVELPEEGVAPPESFLARGEIRLHRLRDESGIKRFISIEKYKGSSHDEFVYPFEIHSVGIVVLVGDAAKAPAE